MALFEYTYDARGRRRREAAEAARKQYEQQILGQQRQFETLPMQGPMPQGVPQDIQRPDIGAWTQGKGLLGKKMGMQEAMLRSAAIPGIKETNIPQILQQAAAMQPQPTELTKGSFFSQKLGRRFTGFYDKQGNLRVYDPQGRNIPAPEDAFPISTAVTGGTEDVGIPTKTQLGKIQLSLDDSEINARTNILAMSDLIDFVASDNYVGGVGGDVIESMNSVVAQARQMMNIDSVLTPDGKLDESKVQLSKENMNRFRRIAITGDRADSAVLELAYVKAKSLDPGGRLSDADVRFAEKMLRSGADKASMINMLRDNMKRIVRSHNQKYQVNKKRHPKLRGERLDIKDILGGGFPEDEDDDLAKRLLEREGIR